MAGRLEFPGSLGEVTAHAPAVQQFGNAIHRIAGSDAVEVDFDGGVFAQLLAVDAQMLMTDSLTDPRQCLSVRRLQHARLRAKAPQVE